MQPLLIEEHTDITYFSTEQLSSLDLNCIPRHVAIILDGNRRWAENHYQTHAQGHQKGADTLMDIIRSAKELSIETLTAYGFSTENWNRSPEEVEAIFWLIEQYVIEQRPQMLANGVKVSYIGNIGEFPDTLLQALEDTMQATAHCNSIHFVLALNYGGRNEICRAINRMMDDMQNGQLPASPIDEKCLTRYLDTHNLPELDLLIRPGGEQRLSNFLLWQASYSELYFLDKMWPDFIPSDLYQAVLEYQKRTRRIGT